MPAIPVELQSRYEDYLRSKPPESLSTEDVKNVTIFSPLHFFSAKKRHAGSAPGIS